MQNVINGVDLKATLDTVVPNVVKMFLSLPDRKGSTSNDWLDENGLDINLDNPKFEARNFSFQFVTSGATMAELTSNYLALATLLKVGGQYQWCNDFVNMSIFVYYIKQTSFDNPYRNSSNGWSVNHTIQFGETDPALNLPNIYLVDDQNRFLVP